MHSKLEEDSCLFLSTLKPRYNDVEGGGNITLLYPLLFNFVGLSCPLPTWLVVVERHVAPNTALRSAI